MNSIQQILTSDWHFMRFVRLGIGLVIGFNAIQDGNGLLGLLSGLFIFQALSNTGCCGAGACSATKQESRTPQTEEISFTEINSPK